ncbi:MAG: NTP transferase domain-containing protein [Planctomycetaceae bacterium]|nr:NTP transferase domain-containing protein [Planctomycetaceae bacterium]
MLHAVIMAGGSGTRFWPLSRKSQPKQFLSLDEKRSLIQHAADRCESIVPDDRLWVVTNESLGTLTRQHLPQLFEGRLLLEPCPRNTAPCLALAAMHLLAVDPEAVMLVLSADHLISTTEQFQKGAAEAHQLVQNDPERLVLFGIRPTFPATGFGYIERGTPLSADAYEVAAFREKPDSETAQAYVDSGKFYWNCGIFCWRADRILAAIEKHEPDLLEPMEKIRETLITQEGYRSALRNGFPKMKAISIDYAVLERESDIAVIEAPFSWDDIGGWEAFARLHGTNAEENVEYGNILALKTHGAILHSDPGTVVATYGMDNCIVVQAGNAVLVANRDDENAMRELIAELQRRGLNEYL